MGKLPIVGITMGDPVGIGPEIILKALADDAIYKVCRPLLLGDQRVMNFTKEWLNTSLPIHSALTPEAATYDAGHITVVDLSELNPDELRLGHPTAQTGAAMVAYITKGAQWAMEQRIDALVTCPINKEAMNIAGVAFEGHTELLADLTGANHCVMMLAGTRLKVALATIHVPLSEVPKRLSSEALVRTIRITYEGLQRCFGLSEPKIAVCALNPHAGENGLFGDDEGRVIKPALEELARAGIETAGPFPADTLFYWALSGKWDAIVAMYHDQGLIPFKMIHFTDGVNTTLGLPIVRTSVDHGTAYDIAGQGRADAGSLVAAIRMAAFQARMRQ